MEYIESKMLQQIYQHYTKLVFICYFSMIILGTWSIYIYIYIYILVTIVTQHSAGCKTRLVKGYRKIFLNMLCLTILFWEGLKPLIFVKLSNWKKYIFDITLAVDIIVGYFAVTCHCIIIMKIYRVVFMFYKDLPL